MGFANLPSLVYLVSIPVLIYIYYFSRRKRRVEISSIIPWRMLRESVITSSLFKADVLFYVQLLGLLVLVLAACRPYWHRQAVSETGRQLVIVMDRSASMQAVEDGTSRWNDARERAGRFLRGLGEGDRVTLIGAGARPELLAHDEENRGKLEEIIGSLDSEDTPDRLAPALSMAFSLMEKGADGESAADPELAVFTDRSPESLGFGERGRTDTVRVVRVGSPKGNRAITSVSVFRNLFSSEQRVSCYVTLENFSDERFSGSLKVQDRGREVASKEVALGPREERTTKLGEGLPEGIFEVVLEPSDALEVDNRAYLLVGRKETLRVALFADDAGIRRQFHELAAAIPNVEIDVFSPAAYSRTDMGPYRLAIFHRWEPENEPPADMLIIEPPVRSRVVKVLKEWIPDVSFLDWDEGHPVGQNLRGLQNISLRGCRLLEVPSWAQPVVISATTSGDIPLLLCGNYRGRKTAVMSFDIGELDLKRSDSMPALLLLLNTLNWLVVDERSEVRTGEPYEGFIPVVRQSRKRGAAEGATAQGGGAAAEAGLCAIINPRGREEQIEVGPDGRFSFADTEYIGRYLLSGELAEKTFVANLCDSAESDLLSERGDEEDGLDVKELISVKVSPRAGPDRTTLFLFLVLAILLLEWLFYVAQRRGWLKAAKS